MLVAVLGGGAISITACSGFSSSFCCRAFTGASVIGQGPSCKAITGRRCFCRYLSRPVGRRGADAVLGCVERRRGTLPRSCGCWRLCRVR